VGYPGRVTKELLLSQFTFERNPITVTGVSKAHTFFLLRSLRGLAARLAFLPVSDPLIFGGLWFYISYPAPSRLYATAFSYFPSAHLLTSRQFGHFHYSLRDSLFDSCLNKRLSNSICSPAVLFWLFKPAFLFFEGVLSDENCSQ